MQIWVFSAPRVKNGHFRENRGCRVKKGPFLGKILEGSKITIFKKFTKWSKIIKNGPRYKNSVIFVPHKPPDLPLFSNPYRYTGQKKQQRKNLKNVQKPLKVFLAILCGKKVRIWVFLAPRVKKMAIFNKIGAVGSKKKKDQAHKMAQFHPNFNGICLVL